MLDKLNIGKLFGNSAPTSEPVQQDIVGIDISHSYVRTIGLKKKNKKWSLHKISTKVLDESYENDEKRNEAIVNLLKTIKLEQKFETENAAISLPVNAAIVQVIQIPYLDEKELKEALRCQVISPNIPFSGRPSEKTAKKICCHSFLWHHVLLKSKRIVI